MNPGNNNSPDLGMSYTILFTDCKTDGVNGKERQANTKILQKYMMS
jgi:hypothetical protein